MEVHVARASAVVVQHVPPAHADWFMEWQRGVSMAAEEFAGYRGTDVYPPADSRGNEWVIIVHFDDEKSLQEWLDSPARAEWISKLREEESNFVLKPLAGGFDSWFATPIPSWKIALTVVLGLYPTVMLLSLFPGRYMGALGLAFAMLISNALSVSILQWAVMPALNILLAPWHRASWNRQKNLSIGGTLAILVVLVCLALLFRQITG